MRTKAETVQALDPARFDRLTLRDFGETWSVETPLIFGAKNWVLLFEARESRITAIRVRTPDSYVIRPPDAPVDVVRPPQ